VATPPSAPTLTVAMPNHNDWHAIPSTIESILLTRTADERVEIVIVDDASTQQPPTATITAVLARSARHAVKVRVIMSTRRLGVAGARNLACRRSRGDVIVMTDAHVNFSRGWDSHILRQIKPGTVLAGAVRDPTSRFVGYGCTLIVPFMGTRWVRNCVSPGSETQVASSAATVFLRETFHHVGGFDEGMQIYGGAEPEFSVRAWLAGARIEACPDHVVLHRFKTAPQRAAFIRQVRKFHIHNNMRFGLLYLTRPQALEMLRHLAMKFPKHAPQALELLSGSDVWVRRERLAHRLPHDFRWFVERFKLRNQNGDPIQ
jgi:GT2 family glycosyltransferase